MCHIGIICDIEKRVICIKELKNIWQTWKKFVKYINEQSICTITVWFIITLNHKKFYLNIGNLFKKMLVKTPKCQPIYMT